MTRRRVARAAAAGLIWIGCAAFAAAPAQAQPDVSSPLDLRATVEQADHKMAQLESYTLEVVVHGDANSTSQTDSFEVVHSGENTSVYETATSTAYFTHGRDSYSRTAGAPWQPLPGEPDLVRLGVDYGQLGHWETLGSQEISGALCHGISAIGPGGSPVVPHVVYQWWVGADDGYVRALSSVAALTSGGARRTTWRYDDFNAAPPANAPDDLTFGT
jgi:hypothetical protein